MSLFRPRKVEQRAITEVPWDHGGPLSPTKMTQERAQRLAPVFAANRHLADQIATLPLHAYRKVGDSRQKLAMLPKLLRFREEEGTLVDWISRAVNSLGYQGNAIGVITSFDRWMFPADVMWRPRSEFQVDDLTTPGQPQWFWNGRRIDRDLIVHIPWLTLPGRTLALSPVEAFAVTVEAGLKPQEFGVDWFTAGGHPPGTFKNTAKTIDQKEANVIKARLVSSIKTREPIVYGTDWDFTPITISPGDAQFVETQKLTANQIAAIYGLDPEEVGGEAANSLTYNNEEHRQSKRLANIRPWLVRIENGLSALLPDRVYVRFNADAVVRSDLKSRHEVYKIGREIGLMNTDEIRALEDLPPLPNGEGQDYAPLRGSAPGGVKDE